MSQNITDGVRAPQVSTFSSRAKDVYRLSCAATQKHTKILYVLYRA